jgi:phosphatidylglycerol:prolipoprotein diacylglycerol transferase
LSFLPAATITIGIDPTVDLGPITLAWHGITIALGILVAALLARIAYPRDRGVDPDTLVNVAMVMAVSGIVGARLFFLLENEPGGLLDPGELIGTRGFAFNGALILSPIGAALYLWRKRLSLIYMDALALGFPLGMAVGRIGDVINGEHYGSPTDAPWGVRNTHPDADVPSATVAYHSGGLYEVVLALAVFALVWPLRGRFRQPLIALWTVVATYASGRFVMFFFRSDSEDLALGLNTSQWASLALVALAAVGALASTRWSRTRSDPLASDG